MTARKELEHKARQLTELTNATCDALASKELSDSRREGLRKQVDLGRRAEAGPEMAMGDSPDGSIRATMIKPLVCDTENGSVHACARCSESIEVLTHFSAAAPPDRTAVRNALI